MDNQVAAAQPAIDSGAEQICTLAGKDHTNRFTVVAGSQDVDSTTQQLTTRPARVFSNQTGQFVGQPAGQSQRAAMPPGMTRQVGTSGGKPVYEDAQGKRFVGGVRHAAKGATSETWRHLLSLARWVSARAFGEGLVSIRPSHYGQRRS